MAMEDDLDQDPIGKRVRDILKPALDDERRPEIQLGILNEIFANTAEILPLVLAKNLSRLFNGLAEREGEGDRNEQVIRLLTDTDKQGNALYSPILPMRAPIANAFTEFSADQIKSLPGYIKLHEAARDADVALRLVGVVVDEVKSAGGMGPSPTLIVDSSKTYSEGALENTSLYPDLPPPQQPPAPFNRNTGRDFRL